MVQEISICELAYRAKKIVRMSQPYRRVARGDTHGHRMPQSWAGFTATGKVIESIHYGNLMSFTAVERVLLDVYTTELALGGRSKIDWAWRSSLYAYYCEPCETLFWLHQLPDRMPLWPATYFPGDDIIFQLETLYPRGFLLGLK